MVDQPGEVHMQDECAAACDQRQRQTLDEQLLNQTATAGAQSQPHGNLPASGGGPSQQQARDIGAGNQQNERNEEQQKTKEQENWRCVIVLSQPIQARQRIHALDSAQISIGLWIQLL